MALNTLFKNYIVIHPLPIRIDCVKNCADEYKEDLYFSSLKMGWINGSIESRTGDIPPNLEFVYLGRGTMPWGFREVNIRVSVFGSYTISTKDKSFILPVPFGILDRLEYYVLARNPDGSYMILYENTINNPSFHSYSTLDLGTIPVPIDVYRLTGVISDIDQFKDRVRVYAYGVSNLNPNMTVTIPGGVYENGTFEVYIIQNLINGSITHQFTYEVDVKSDFYCQLNNPDFPSNTYTSDTYIGETTCLSAPIKMVKIDVYRSGLPIPMTPEAWIYLPCVIYIF